MNNPISKYSPLWIHKEKMNLVEKLQYKILEKYNVKLKKNEMIEAIVETILNNEDLLDKIMEHIEIE